MCQKCMVALDVINPEHNYLYHTFKIDILLSFISDRVRLGRRDYWPGEEV